MLFDITCARLYLLRIILICQKPLTLMVNLAIGCKSTPCECPWLLHQNTKLLIGVLFNVVFLSSSSPSSSSLLKFLFITKSKTVELKNDHV